MEESEKDIKSQRIKEKSVCVKTDTRRRTDKLRDTGRVQSRPVSSFEM